jgi:hypothetical protein
LATITKTNRTGSQTSVSRNALAQIENVMRDQSENPKATSSSKQTSSKNDSGQSSDAVRNAATAAASNARATKDSIEAVQVKCGLILEKLDTLETNQATFTAALDQINESIGRLEEAMRTLDVARATTSNNNRNFTGVI